MSDEPKVVVLPTQSRVFFVGVMALMLILVWTLFKPFLIYMVTGIFVAVLALPIDKWYKKRMPNRLSAMMTILTLLIILALPLLGLGIALFNDVGEVTEAVANGEAEVWVENTLENPIVKRGLDAMYPNQTSEERNATIAKTVQNGEDRALELLGDLAKNLVQALPNFFIGLTVILFVVYYVLVDGVRLVAWLDRAVPLPSSQVSFLLQEGRNGLRAVFVGQILTSAIQGALGGIGFFIAGLPGAILWAGVMAILSLLPVVGAFIVWVPAAIYLLAVGDVWQAVFLTIWGVVLVSQVDNFVRPKLIGDRASIHPIFVLLGVLGGVAAFGFIGLFLGPLMVGVTIAIIKVWEAEYLHPDVRTPG